MVSPDAEWSFLNGVAVEERAVAAAKIDEPEAASRFGPQFEMPAGDLRVVQGHRVRGVPSDRDRGPGQIELLSLIHSARDDQSRHKPVPPGDGDTVLSRTRSGQWKSGTNWTA